MYRLAHLSDPHLSDWSLPSYRLLASKRFFGYLSWRLRRLKIHGGPVLGQTLMDLQRMAPDHIAVTGDITNLSLPGEFSKAAIWLQKLGKPEQVTVIPGNHDAYIRVSWEEGLGKWANYMAGGQIGSEELYRKERPVQSLEEFPIVRLRGPLALIGLSSAVPTWPLLAGGRLGTQQLAALKAHLQRLRGYFRVILIHHPPAGNGPRRKGLWDWQPLQEVVAAEGAELILHGHMHRSYLTKIPAPIGYVPVIGVPSASAWPHGHKDYARYHLYEVERQGERVWRLHLVVRGLNMEEGVFTEEGRFHLTVPA